MNWIGPEEIQTIFKVGRTKSFELIREFSKEHEDMVVHTGKRQRRVPEEKFTEFVLKRWKE